MKIYYQGEPWAYSNVASEAIKNKLDIEINKINWVTDFPSVWEKIEENNIWVLPVENSYAWSIHENLYNFLRYDFEIIWEYDLEVNHCLLSNEDGIENIKTAYSHPQALSQTHDFLKKSESKVSSMLYFLKHTPWKPRQKSRMWAICALAWIHILTTAFILRQVCNTYRAFL